MKKFILDFFVFLTLSLIFASILDIIISNNLKESKDRMLQAWNDMYSDKSYHDVIIMGSSRAENHFSPKILDSVLNINCFNLAINGSQINRQIAKYHAYCRCHSKPKYVVQNIDFTTLGIRTGYEREQYYPYFLSDKLLISEMSQFEKFSWMENNIPCFRYYGYPLLIQHGLGISKVATGHTSVGILYKGFSIVNGGWHGESYRKQTKILYNKDSLALQIFDNYLKELKQDGVKTIFVYSPLYIGATNKIENIEGMYKMYDSFAVKYNIPILDYNYWSLCSDTTCFYNAMHLNKKGAEMFSRKLAHDLDSLGIIKRR